MDITFSQLFTIDIPVLEIFIRGTCMYLGVFLILRLILQREVGSVGIPDLIMITLIADAAQNGLAGEYNSINSGLLLVMVIVFWNSILDWLSARFEWIENLTRGRPLCLIRKGRIQGKNLRLASMSHRELSSLLREEGIESATEVKAAYLEGDGKLSVIK